MVYCTQIQRDGGTKMGTIIALGGGRFDNGEMLSVAQFIRDASGKAHPHVLFLPTAGFDDMNGAEPIRAAFLSPGCTFEALLLTDAALTAEQVHETILGCDIVYAGGGNLQFLMDTWNRTGASDALREAFDRGVVLSGLSSGAMCWFEGGYDDCGTDHAFVFIPCLGLLPHYYCPHFISESWQSFALRVPETGKSGIGVEDGSTASSPATRAATHSFLTRRRVIKKYALRITPRSSARNTARIFPASTARACASHAPTAAFSRGCAYTTTRNTVRSNWACMKTRWRSTVGSFTAAASAQSNRSAKRELCSGWADRCAG